MTLLRKCNWNCIVAKLQGLLCFPPPHTHSRAFRACPRVPGNPQPGGSHAARQRHSPERSPRRSSPRRLPGSRSRISASAACLSPSRSPVDPRRSGVASARAGRGGAWRGEAGHSAAGEGREVSSLESASVAHARRQAREWQAGRRGGGGPARGPARGRAAVVCGRDGGEFERSVVRVGPGEPGAGPARRPGS